MDDDISPKKCAQIDHVLSHASILGGTLQNAPTVALNNHHYLLTAELNLQFQSSAAHARPHVDNASVRDPAFVHEAFLQRVVRY
eukprot:4790179-Pyramimonas_sp.AAC.1